MNGNGSKAPKESKAPKDAKGSKESKEPEGSKGSKGSKVSAIAKGPDDLRIPSPLSPELDQLVYRVIGAAMKVHTALGPGLLEQSYADALALELSRCDIAFQRDVPIDLKYEGKAIHRYRADFIVAEAIILELKTVAARHPAHSSQVLTYLRATGLPVGILVNFHERHLRNGIRRHVLHPVKRKETDADGS